MITANLPLYTMKTFVETGCVSTILVLQTNMKQDGKAVTAYEAHLTFNSGHQKVLRGYSTQSNQCDVMQLAKKRAERYIQSWNDG